MAALLQNLRNRNTIALQAPALEQGYDAERQPPAWSA
jgi:hypothetical protein